MSQPAKKTREFGALCPLHQIRCFKNICAEKCDAWAKASPIDRIKAPASATTAGTVTPILQPAPAIIKPTPLCHTGMNLIGSAANMRLWAGKQSSCLLTTPEGRPWSLVVSLVGHDKYFQGSEHIVGGNAGAKALFPADVFVETVPAPFMHLEWPDFGVPALDLEWWRQFLLALVAIEGDVAVFCMGGHGRTGTMLSIIAHMVGWSGGKDPIAWVRSVYCKETVESDEQVAYITKMTGCDITSLPTQSDVLYGLHGNTYSKYETFWDKYEKNAATAKPTASVDVSLDVDPDAPTVLSKNEYKRYAKAMRKAGRHCPPLGELEDGSEVAYGGHIWMWNKVDNHFEWLGELTDDGEEKGD